jgi:hypothetical protein
MALHRILSRLTLAAAGLAAAAGFDTVFRGSRWVLPVLGAAAIPHVVGSLLGRSRASTITIAASLVAGALFAAWVLVPESTVAGFPAGGAWNELGRLLGHGWDRLRLSDAPFRPGDGAVLLALVASFTASSVSERLAHFIRIGAFLTSSPCGPSALCVEAVLQYALNNRHDKPFAPSRHCSHRVLLYQLPLLCP